MEVNRERQIQLWVVDRLDWWRASFVDILQRAGFAVRAYGEYEELLAVSGAGPDLVLLGCVGPRPEETAVLRELAQRGFPVVVLASSLSVRDLHEFFLAGASDV